MAYRRLALFLPLALGAHRHTDRLGIWLFLRGISAIYAVAFLALAIQLPGLLGSRGILPVAEALVVGRANLGASRYLLAPSLFWWTGGSDLLLRVLAWTGVLLALLLFCDLAPAWIAFALWALYLSFVSLGRDFFFFQWDSLLLEAGLLAVLIAPWRLRPDWGGAPAPPPLAAFWLRWLLFRVLFLSGVVKLASGDTAWRALTALQYHYETQPLPSPLSWFCFHLPLGFHEGTTFLVLATELVVPFLFFTGRLGRLFGFAASVLLQLFILLTGNHAFYNGLTLVLCFALLDDSLLRRFFPRLPCDPRPASPLQRRWSPVLGGLLFLLSLPLFLAVLGVRPPRPVASVLAAISPFRSVNDYGAFAVMTTRRLEIEIEGSQDGKSWRVYPFRWKPGELRKMPAFVAPYQPRLDWQMWFAALNGPARTPWFPRLAQRLLEGSPEVAALFASNPFAEAPPTYVRALLYEYRFSSWGALQHTGEWWQRELIGVYLPPTALRRPTPGEEAERLVPALESRGNLSLNR
ncbi:lipase maturation factor family protein [Methylacidimicrobium sp. B4]|uniref:lipase maturation factor family protein n=1 Tax=Methylacidimicrobium sp. B4 TaxID=2796139 RepID=UPI001A90BF12|nr:lipase maturation factor family protein [Methylacidimicrobium sp. B4]QSR84968.1 lipase maturation factor family protein [Methylacidimicrobium sp. B4]